MEVVEQELPLTGQHVDSSIELLSTGLAGAHCLVPGELKFGLPSTTTLESSPAEVLSVRGVIACSGCWLILSC